MVHNSNISSNNTNNSTNNTLRIFNFWPNKSVNMGGIEDISSMETSAATEKHNNTPITVEAAVKAVKAGNAKDVDIAAQIIADYAEEMVDGWSEEEEKKLIRKVDWWLVPIVSDDGILYIYI